MALGPRANSFPAAALDVRLLGPLELRHDGQALQLGSTKQRVTLAVLLLARNRVVSIDQLADILWPDGPPRTAPGVIRTHLSRLRSIIAPCGEALRIVRDGSGYRLTVPAECCDVDRFVAALDEARAAVATPDLGRAVDWFQAGLDEWRGPVLGDLASWEFARPEAARLEEMRVTATEEHLAARLDLGHLGDLIAQLEAAVQLYPLRERLWALLMVALYRSGRQAEALRAYQSLRNILGEQLGIDPSPAVQALERQILIQDPVLLGSASAAGTEPAPSAGAPRVDLPRLISRRKRRVVGRSAELDDLRARWQGVQSGRAETVFLAGDPGVGKTALATALAAQVHAEGGVVLAGHCDDGLGVPFQPFVEAVDEIIQQTGDDNLLRRRLGPQAPELARVVPALRRRLPDLPPPEEADAETKLYHLFEAFGGWLEAMASEAPVLLIIDDLQWATKPTLLALRHVARWRTPIPLLIVGTYRDTEAEAMREILGDLRRDPGLGQIQIEGLTEAGVRAMVADAAGHDLDGGTLATADEIYAATKGNPFFVLEMIRHAREAGVVQQQGLRWVRVATFADVATPEGVRDVVRQRVARLSPPAQDLLKAAAVAGEEVDVDILSESADLPEPLFLLAQEEAVRARFLVDIPGPRPKVRFAHALGRAALLEELGAERTRRLHASVARSIEAVRAGELSEYVAALARHFGAAGPSEWKASFRYRLAAAEVATSRLAYTEAVDHLRAALGLLRSFDPDDDEARLDVLVRLGEAEKQAGDPRHRTDLFDAAHLAQALGNVDQLCRAALLNSRDTHYSTIGEVDRERVAVIEAALAALSSDDVARRAPLLANLGLELIFAQEHDRRIALSDEALAGARSLGDVAILTQVLVSRFVTIWEPATLRERKMNVRELDIAARCLDDPLAVWQATWLRCRLLTEQGHIGEAERTLAEIEELSARLARPALHWRTTWTRAGVLLAAGVVDAGEQTYREAFELGAAVGEPDVRRWYAVQRFEVLLEVDRLANLDPELVTTLDEYEAFPHFQAERATLDLHRGLSQPAAERLQQLAGGGFAGIPVDLFWLRTMTLCAHLSAALGEAGHANTLRALLVPYADVASALGGVFSGVTGYYLGLLDELVGEWDRAAETFGRAADLHRVGGAPRWHVRSELGRLRSLSHLAGISGEQISALAARVRADAGRLGMTAAAVEASTFL